MINLVTLDDVVEVAPNDFVAVAADFGWRPSNFPDQIHTTLGNGRDLIAVKSDEAFTRYEQICGCITLTIFND